MPRPSLRPLLLLALAACGTPPADTSAVTTPPRDYLYVWTASTDSTQPDFLAVLDVTEESARYGDLVTTVPVAGLANGPHHTEHEMPADGQLFANGFATGRTFVFDAATDPAHPTVATSFGDVNGLSHPHSFLRLPNGHVLATFQMRHDANGMSPGGLVELRPAGGVVRSVSANAPGLDPATRVYSAGVVPALDRIVTTTSDMDVDTEASRQLQVWRLSDVALLHTIRLSDGPVGGEGLLTAEPRLLRDGRTMLVSTFTCGLYLLDGLDGARRPLRGTDVATRGHRGRRAARRRLLAAGRPVSGNAGSRVPCPAWRTRTGCVTRRSGLRPPEPRRLRRLLAPAARLTLVTSSANVGDCAVPAGRDGVGEGERLRVECTTGRVLGIVPAR